MEDAAVLIEQVKESTNTWRKHQCRHIMPEGIRCGSPALRDERFCYHHHQTRRPIADARKRQARRNAFGMPVPNSRAEIQDSIGRIISHIAGNEIDLRRAGLLLYALQLASTNLTEHQRRKSADQTLSTDPQTAPPPEHPHYGTGPKPAFTSDGEPISTVQPPPPQPDDFTPLPAKWHRLNVATGRTLLDALGRHHSQTALPGKPEDRKNSEATDEVIHTTITVFSTEAQRTGETCCSPEGHQKDP
jgi:hypothetical protein